MNDLTYSEEKEYQLKFIIELFRNGAMDTTSYRKSREYIILMEDETNE